MEDKKPKEVKMTAGSGSGVGRAQKAAMAGKGAPKHIHDPKTHADAHGTGHKKIERMMREPYHNSTGGKAGLTSGGKKSEWRG
jgi:hypothetical protein